jgi:hypothetical protein
LVQKDSAGVIFLFWLLAEWEGPNKQKTSIDSNIKEKCLRDNKIKVIGENF